MAAAIRLSQQHSCSFNYLVGEYVELRRDSDAKRVGGLVIDYQIEACGLFYRQIAGSRALENLVHIECGAAEEIREVLAVAQQPAGLCIFTKRKHRWDAVPERERGNSLPLSKENRV